MVLCVKAFFEDGKSVRGFLKRKRVYEDSFLPEIKENYVYLPIREISDLDKKEILDSFKVEFCDLELRENNRTRSFRRELEKVLPKDIYPKVSRAYEQIGSIAIIDVFDLAKKYEKEIAKALMDTNKGVSTVLKKSGVHDGDNRLIKYELVLGEDTRETVYHENGVDIFLDVEKTYFSARTVNERKRVASLVNDYEDVLVMFSGVAPFPCVIAKNSNCKTVYGIEWNKTAHEYGLKNVSSNNLDNVILINDDVSKVCNKLKVNFDKVIMPSPSDADYFLDSAFKVLKDKAEIYLYLFSKENKLDKVKDKVLDSCKKFSFDLKKIDYVKQQKIKEGVFKYCIEIKVKKKN